MAGEAKEMKKVDKLPQSKVLHYLIEISFFCENLPNMDKNSQSDAFIKVESKDNQGNWKEFETETIMNNNSPSFIKRLRMEYAFEKEQKICLQILESDNNNGDKKNRELRKIDQTEFFLSQLITTNELSIPLTTYPSLGTTIKMKYLEVSSDPEDILKFEISGANIKGLGRSFFSTIFKCETGKKSNPYLEFWRATERDGSIPIYRTEAMMNDCDPNWNPIQIKMQQLWKRDEESEITIKCIHYLRFQNDRVIGEVRVTPKKLGSGTNEILILKGGEKGNEVVGELNIVNGAITRHPLNSFPDYIRGGSEINLMVAIDFTASNGRATEKDSLHYVDPQNPYRVDCDGNPTGGSPNQYQQAITKIGGILAKYDADQKIPFWGFGAKRLRTVEDVSSPKVLHWFDISSNNDPNLGVDGVNGMLKAYYDKIPNLDFSGPTRFAEVLSHANSIAKNFHISNLKGIPLGKPAKYSILLIITDGVLEDFQKTKDCIVHAANNNLPLSIVIVGVGNANYKDMNELDGDQFPIRSSDHVEACRDIVQFVAFQDKKSVEDLAAETLEEIPDQFLYYMRKIRFIVPKRQDRFDVPKHLQSDYEHINIG